MKRGQWSEIADAVRTASPHGVIRTSALEKLGVSASGIVRRCLPDGPWQRTLPGVIVLHNGDVSEHQRAVAALMYAGTDAILTGTSALAVLGYRSSSNRVHVLVPHHVRRKSVEFTEIERSRRLPEPTHHRGIAVAPITRATVDAVRRCRTEEQCLDILAKSIQRGATSVDELAIELAQCTTRGTALPRRQLQKLGSGAHSIAEVGAHKLYATTTLPTMMANCDIVDASGQFIARPDVWIDEVALAWEIDSLAHHSTIADHERTLLRRTRMQAHGIIVISHLPRTVRDSPDLVRSELAAAYAAALARPRPPVRVRPHPGSESGAP